MSNLQTELSGRARQLEEAYNSLDASAVAAVYADDGAIELPNETVSGEEAIRGYWRGAMDAGIKRIEIRPNSATLDEATGSAQETGTIIATLEGVPEEQTSGDYQFDWIKDGDDWYIQRSRWSRPPIVTD